MKHIPRVFLNLNLNLGQVVNLDKETAHHLIQVLRLNSGEALIVFNGRGGEFESELLITGKKQTSVVLHKFRDISRESRLKVELIQSITRNERMDLIVQKAVELGAQSLTPVWSDFSNVKIDAGLAEKRLAHWQKIIISATEQSGRCELMKLNPPQKLSAWFAQKNSFDLKLICHPGETEPAKLNKDNKTACVLIGPEGGLSDAEVKTAHAQGFQNLSLGPRILRAETAAIAALALVQKEWGDI